ncbi:MAG: DNA polymerase III subunit alpha [Propionibacteriaceae bacterium]|jgi:error-prone DNA polymerase|nr:DNA polymerase III subunit alpha [Propionibacteriaceae bacterium]
MFTHLQVASGFSFRYGTALPERLVAAAAELGMGALALTDRASLSGAVRFMKAAEAAGVKPIIGAQLGPVTVLAEPGGWGELCRAVSAGQVPVGSRHLVVLLSTLDQAELRRWQWLVPAENLRIAVTDHLVAGEGPGSSRHAARMLAFADRQRVPAVLTNAVRMVAKAEAPTADVLDSVRRLIPLSAIKRGNAEGYLKSPEAMAALAQKVSVAAGRADGRQLVDTTNALGERLALTGADIGMGITSLPEYRFIEASEADPRAELRARCEQGIRERFGVETPELRARLEDELRVIAGFDFERYFLTVGDVVRMVKARGIRVAARGSGAGSLVNYLLWISGVDPLRNGLVFERFLNPLRRKMPDIDIDVESARRLEVYDMIRERFGAERVACVGMVETYRVRHAIRDVGKALSLPANEVDVLAKAFPHIRAARARDALRELPELRKIGIDERRMGVLLNLVESLDGLPRHLAMHPCGVLIADATLGERTPLLPSPEGYPVSHFDKDDVDDLAMLKLDVLGVRMQSAIAHATELIKGQGAPDVDQLSPFTDPATYALIQRCDTIGCFQIESPGQRELIGKFQPDCFEDLIVDISLFRPGPVKADMVVPFLNARLGWNPPAYLHPSLKPVLAQTSGVVVYHEQVIQVFSVVTGCSLAEGEQARRALANPDQTGPTRQWFMTAAASRGYPQPVAEQIWQTLASFASFGFCKAHAAAFALPTYQSAWLKAHYPAEFFAGILTHDPGMYPKRLLLHHARLSGVPIRGVDVNQSKDVYTTEPVAGGGTAIRIPLTEVANISTSEVERIIAGQPYASLTDFHKRAQVSAPVLEALVLIGAFDSLYAAPSRRDLLLAAADLQRATPRQLTTTQLALELDDAVEDIRPSGLPPFAIEEQVAAELDYLGMDVTRHVLTERLEYLEGIGVTFAKDLLARSASASGRKEVLVAGVKVATQTPPVRSGNRVIFLTLDDSTGLVDVTFFADAQAKCAATVFNSWQLVCKGEIRRTGKRGISIRATECWDMGQAATAAPKKLWFASPGSAG